MSIRALKKWALLLTFWVALQTRHLQGQTISGNTVSGNFTVTGNSDLQGDTLTLGTRTDTSDAGVLTLYTDGTISTLEFDASRSANIWKWQQNGGATLQMQMSLNLNNNNELVLYNQASTPVAEITLNPLGTSTFANSLTVNGTDNEMPNQTLVNANSVLTESLADSRYLSSANSGITIGSSPGDPTLSFNGGTASGPYSFAEGHSVTASGYAATAMGEHSTASGGNSIAMGYGSNATGIYSIAIGASTTASGLGSTAIGLETTASGYGPTALGGYTTASGYYSTAMGYFTITSGAYSTAMGHSTTASGAYSTAIGSHTTASGNGSTAIGGHSTASGYYSTASGIYTQAQAYDSFVIGTYNVGLNASGGTASANYWAATDPLFEIGNGTSSAPADALVVYKNGNAAVQGTLSAAYLNITGSVSTYGAVNAASLTTPNASISTTGVITAQPGGDIPMYTGN